MKSKTLQSSILQFPLWSDDPASTDFLSFQAVADTVVDAMLDDALDPVAIGLSGKWGSGKTTVLHQVGSTLKRQNTDASKIVVVNTDPWRYDPTTGAKESLIAEVLNGLAKEVKSNEGTGDKAKKLFSRLMKRVDWAKAISLTTKAAVALQIPSFDDLVGIIKDKADSDDEAVRGLEAFREEFAELMTSSELAHVRRVVVLVDDLDRCLPETVVETLEAIRLFLAVPKMSFVLAADEDRVADAVRSKFLYSASTDDSDSVEEPAKLYLHKIVQTTVPIPSLSRFDTQAYLLLLLLMGKLKNEDQFLQFVQQCTDLRQNSKDIDDLPGIEGVDINDELAFTARLTPLLYEKLHGNPRRIKRFLNDLHVRQSIASRRGIKLNAPIVAKLMILEVLLNTEFKLVLEWVAKGELRTNMASLEIIAGKVRADTFQEVKDATKKSDETNDTPVFPEQLIRWAKLPPTFADTDLTPYLHLAASFSGKILLDENLPERLRDIATNLFSDFKAEQYSVRDEDLQALSSSEASVLIIHLGRMGRDRPGSQRKAVTGVLRIARIHNDSIENAKKILLAIPADEVALPTILLFSMPKDSDFRPVLEQWKTMTKNARTKTAVDEMLKKGSA